MGLLGIGFEGTLFFGIGFPFEGGLLKPRWIRHSQSQVVE
jgi:hypothetical protein